MRHFASCSPSQGQAAARVPDAFDFKNVKAEALENSGAFGRLDLMAASDLMSKICGAARGPEATPQLRHVAREVERRGAAMLTIKKMLKGRSMLRVVAARVTAREDHGQVRACQDLMAIEIRGAGKGADADLCHFYDEWAKNIHEMEKPRKLFQPC